MKKNIGMLKGFLDSFRPFKKNKDEISEGT